MAQPAAAAAAHSCRAQASELLYTLRSFLQLLILSPRSARANLKSDSIFILHLDELSQND